MLLAEVAVKRTMLVNDCVVILLETTQLVQSLRLPWCGREFRLNL